MDDGTTRANPWQAVCEAMVTHVLRALQVIYDDFNVSLERWLNDMVSHPIAANWRDEVAAFVKDTERKGLRILPDSIRVIEALIESRIAGTGQFAQCGPARRAPARTVLLAQPVGSAAPDEMEDQAVPVIYPPLQTAHDLEPSPSAGAEQLFDRKLASARIHLNTLERLLEALDEKIKAAKPGVEVNLGYEAAMVEKHLFLYDEDLVVARDLWLRFNLSGNANTRLIAMPTPVGLGLPMFVRPELAERVKRQEAAIGRRLGGRSASLDAAVTGMEVGETAANAASLVTGAGLVFVAAKKGGTWAVVKTVGVGVGIYFDTKIAETTLHKAGASDQAIQGAELAAAVVTLILLHKATNRAAPQKPATAGPRSSASPTDANVSGSPPRARAEQGAPELPAQGVARRPIAAGNPELGKLIRDVAGKKLTGAEKVKLLTEGAAKIDGVVFEPVTGFPGVAGIFKGVPPSSGGPAQILVVLKNGRVFKGPATAIRTGPSGARGIFINELNEVL